MTWADGSPACKCGVAGLRRATHAEWSMDVAKSWPKGTVARLAAPSGSLPTTGRTMGAVVARAAEVARPPSFSVCIPGP